MSKTPKGKHRLSKEPKCSSMKCLSKYHGDQICEAVRKESSTDDQSIAYMIQLCGSFFRAVDSDGRSALHTACIVGKNRVVQYLVTFGADINLQDSENLYTPLHLATMCGQISTALILIKNGADVKLVDKHGFSASHYMTKQLPLKVSTARHPNFQVFCWGINANYNLGLAKAQTREIPDHLDFYFAKDMSVRDISMNKFHSVFLTKCGRVFTCGHGSGGRLGLESNTSVIIPECVDVSDHSIIKISAGVNHTLFLNSKNQVISCGLNQYHQLGLGVSLTQISIPQVLYSWHSKNPSVKIIGVRASAFHSAMWSDSEVFTCGLNAGQLGHPKSHELYIESPKSSRFIQHLDKARNGSIEDVVVSDGATVITTSLGDIFACAGFRVNRICPRLNVKIIKISCSGGNLDFPSELNLPHGHKKHDFKIAALTTNFSVSLWHNNVWSSISRTDIVDVSLNTQSLLLATTKGEVYTTLHCEKNPSSDLNSLKKIPSLYRARHVFSDPKGKNFMALQYDPKLFIMRRIGVPFNDIKEDIGEFYKAIYDPSLHDVEVVVNSQKFPANAYIISYQCKKLHKVLLHIIKERDGTDYDENMEINMSSLDPIVVKNVLDIMYGLRPSDFYNEKRFLTFSPEKTENFQSALVRIKRNETSKQIEMYTKYTEARKLISKKEQKVLNDKSSVTFPLKPYVTACLEIGMDGLLNYILECNDAELENGHCGSIYKPVFEFDRECFPEFWDVRLRSSDGKVFNAHKCILAARSSYLGTLIDCRWAPSGQSAILDVSVPSSVLRVILDFLYTNDSQLLLASKDMSFICEVLVTAHLFMLDALHVKCQLCLLKFLSLRNAFEMLGLCKMFDADKLKRVILEFICLNLDYYLDTRLKEIDDESIILVHSTFHSTMLKTCDERLDKPKISNTRVNKKSETVNQTPPTNDERKAEFKNIFEMTNRFDIMMDLGDDWSDSEYVLESNYSMENDVNKSNEFDDLDEDEAESDCVYEYIPEAVFVQEVFQTSVQSSDLPSLEDLEDALKLCPSIANETFEDWLKNNEGHVDTQMCSPNEGKRKVQHRKRVRKTSRSSRLSSSSASESEGVSGFDTSLTEQFSFDDLEERNPQERLKTKDQWYEISKNKQYVTADPEDVEVTSSTTVNKSIARPPEKADTLSPRALETTVKTTHEPQVLRSDSNTNAKDVSTTAVSQFPSLTESLTISEAAKEEAAMAKRMAKTPSKFEKKSKNRSARNADEGNPSEKSLCSSYPPWGKDNTNGYVSLADLMKHEAALAAPQISTKFANVSMSPASSAANSKSPWKASKNKSELNGRRSSDQFDNDVKSPSDSWACSPREGRNRWSSGEGNSDSAEGVKPNRSFTSIVEEEKAYKRTIDLEKNKTLTAIQLEEKAMKEIFEFYGGEFNPEERITVQRYRPFLTNPSWDVPNKQL